MIIIIGRRRRTATTTYNNKQSIQRKSKRGEIERSEQGI